MDAPTPLMDQQSPPDTSQDRAPPRADAGGVTRTDKIALAAVISGITGVGMALSLSLPLLSVVLENRGVSPSMIGINTATAGVAAIAVLPFVTQMAERFGTARLIIASFLTMSATLMGFYLITSFTLWFPLRFIFSATATIIFALTEFWINSLAPEKKRGLVVGIYTAFLSVGISIGPLILALVGTDGIAPFAIGSVALLIAAVPVMLVTDRQPVLPGGSHGSIWRFFALAPLALLAALVFGAVESGGAAILPLYGTSLGLTGESAVVLVSAIAAGNVLSQIPIGYLADRMSRRLLLIICGAVGAVGAGLMPFVSDNYPVLLVVLFITGGIVAGLYTVGLVHLGARFKGADLASANAAFVMMYAFGMLIGPVSLGASLDLYPPNGFAYAIAALFAGYVAFACFRTGRTGF
ncbi:MFS transporter [Acuticoccus sp. MNP-M23]|uniref:MFS transporter n=1 Tax=Acuticoccus sp. MNP-M23 TaxID=3072793 RepID=UPI002814E86F|nr:MFS transporter [Acuticoccus sp. MNP-M23]WMS42735.1 MFS transporter [Acuticoccus sp. MNP-M23]